MSSTSDSKTTPPSATLPSFLSSDFLLSQLTPPPVITPIYFRNTVLPDYAPYYAIVLDGLFTPSECTTLLQAAEATADGKWEEAMVNMGAGRQEMAKDTRNSGRIVWDQDEVVRRLWDRIRPHVEGPLEVEMNEAKDEEKEYDCKLLGKGIGVLRGEDSRTIGFRARKGERWVCKGLNDRMRFLKYEGGQYFRPHTDGSYVPPDCKDHSTRSFFTLHLYLNCASPENPLRGGATTFWKSFWDYNDFSSSWEFDEDTPKAKEKEPARLDVEPKMGRVLLFQHADLVHSGDDVLDGVKYTMRTDLMYKKESFEEGG